MEKGSIVSCDKMNVAYPFRKENGRSMRIWINHIFKTQLKKVVDWNPVDKDDYLLALCSQEASEEAAPGNEGSFSRIY